MRTYEALYIVRPDIGDDEIQTVVDGVEKLITDSGGTIVRSETWGKRRLAYEVKKFSEGVYVLVRFQSETAFQDKLRAYFKLSEQIIRDLVVYFDEKTLRLEEEQLKRNQEQLANRGDKDRDDDDDDDDGPRRPRRREEAHSGRGDV